LKFKFPLQTVLSYRKTLENLAQRDFQEAMAILHDEQTKLSFMLEQVTQARVSAFDSQTAGGQAAPHLSQVQDFLVGQDVRIDRQRTKIKECEQTVENLREILRLKAIDYKIIEGLKERKKEEFRIESNKLETKRADEQTTMRFRTEEE
jgi:flagellar FliJ protein